MHTEHLQNVSAGRVVAGWLVAIAMTSLAALALLASRFITDEPSTANTVWSTVAVAAGFFAGGFFAGFRAIQAPVLHAVGIAVMSLAAWVLLNLLASVFFPAWDWPSLTAELALGLLLTQLLFASVGALLGYNVALRGKPGLSEHEPG